MLYGIGLDIFASLCALTNLFISFDYILLFIYIYIFFLNCLVCVGGGGPLGRGHPQLPAVLQCRGHVRPRRRASAPEPRPRLKQST